MNHIFAADTPMSALISVKYQDELKALIESWRKFMIGDDPTIDALKLSHFKFDKKLIYSKDVYAGLLTLYDAGAFKCSLSQIARYLSRHSNLSRSYTALYQQLKHYHHEWK